MWLRNKWFSCSLQYLSQAFPDALFVHVVRDGRAVAGSYLGEIENGRFDTWNEREWWTSGWPPEWRQVWQSKGETPLGFVAYQWKFFVGEIRRDASSVTADRYMEVNYKDIVTLPHETFQRILAFCGLNMGRRIGWYLDRLTLRDMNTKWKETLSRAQRRVLEEIIHEEEYRRLLCEGRWSTAQ